MKHGLEYMHAVHRVMPPYEVLDTFSREMWEHIEDLRDVVRKRYVRQDGGFEHGVDVDRHWTCVGSMGGWNYIAASTRRRAGRR
jgi:hypothetical protein